MPSPENCIPTTSHEEDSDKERIIDPQFTSDEENDSEAGCFNDSE